MKMNQNDWEEVTQAHIAFYGNALIPEQSELNPTGVSLHMAERFAKKHSWDFELRPIYIGGGIYLRVFYFTPAAKPQLDQSIKRNDGEGKGGEEKECTVL